jgi:2-dehydro-3-deoxyphosphogluconate aldolase/(4S)-4-hydroxy-2-oxoglutarate aldolase
VKKEEIRARIEEIAIVPAVRVSSAEHARYAAETVCGSGIPIAEITMTVSGALEVIAGLAKDFPEMIVGAGTVLDVETAQRCVDAGAHFLTSTGFVQEVVEFARKREMLVIAGALTPTELIHAWKAGSDMIKIFPCGQVGGPSYIHTLKVPFPHVPLIAAGGVNQQTALDYVLAGATALGIGGELIPKEALQRKQDHRIRELAKRYLAKIREARARMAAS